MKAILMTTTGKLSSATPESTKDAGFPHFHEVMMTRRENSRSTNWREAYRFHLAVTDGVAVVTGVAAAQVLRFGPAESDLRILSVDVPYWLLGLILAIVWWLALSWNDSREIRLIGDGVEQAKRVASGTAALFGLVAIASYAADVPTARGYVVIALPFGLTGVLIGRWLVRRKLISLRCRGEATAPVLVVGDVASAAHLAGTLTNNPAFGLQPVGMIVVGKEGGCQQITYAGRVPVKGIKLTVVSILASIDEIGADTVVLGSGFGLAPQQLRELGWALADRRIRLIVAPGLSEIAGPRIHTHPLAGLPLVHVTTPQLGTGVQLAKRIADVVAAALLLVILAPILLGLALVVRTEDGGTALFKQKRVGRGGKVFTMYKFRTMVENAEQQLGQLSHQRNLNSDGITFKLADDPRVTRSGRLLRRSSLDELPQLFNVLRGDMSFVGPRPQLLTEVANYQGNMFRRLQVKPGITGLWQVNGRSNLPFEEAIRLDLYYAENWSVTQDLAILAKTFRAVLSRQGAY